MICRRRPIALASVVAASLVPAAWLSPVRADAISSSSVPPHYWALTTTKDIAPADPHAASPQVIFEVPAGSIVAAPDLTDPTGKKLLNPLTPLSTPLQTANGTFTTSPDLSPSLGNVISALKDVTNADGSKAEFLGFSFPGGLTHDKQYVFALNLADPSNPPTLTSLTAGVPSILPVAPLPPPSTQNSSTPLTVTSTTKTITPTATTTPTPAVTDPKVPEPMSLALWSVMTVAGVLRARAFRRRRIA